MSIIYTPYDPTALIAGDFPVRSRTATVLTGQNLAGAVLPRGTLLGRITASDKYAICKSGAADGSQNPVAILAADVDTSAGDVQIPLYFTGEFAFEEMSIDVSWTYATLTAALRIAASVLFVRSVGTIA